MGKLNVKITDRLGRFLDWGRRSRGKAKPAAQPGGQTATLVADEPRGDRPAPADAAEVRTLPARPEAEKPATDVHDLLRSVRTHMEKQSERSERLVEAMQGLPEALRSLPEANRNQTRILAAIEEHLDRQHAGQNRLAEALASLARTTDHQHKTIGVIKEHLGERGQVEQQMLSSFSSLTHTLDRLGDSSAAGTEMLRSLADTTRHRDEQTQRLFQRAHRHMVVMAGISAVLAAGAIVAASYAVSVASAQRPGDATPLASVPAAAAPDTAASGPAEAPASEPPPASPRPPAEAIALAPAAPEGLSPADPVSGGTPVAASLADASVSVFDPVEAALGAVALDVTLPGWMLEPAGPAPDPPAAADPAGEPTSPASDAEPADAVPDAPAEPATDG